MDIKLSFKGKYEEVLQYSGTKLRLVIMRAIKPQPGWGEKDKGEGKGRTRRIWKNAAELP